jgi:hypothetical protein
VSRVRSLSSTTTDARRVCRELCLVHVPYLSRVSRNLVQPRVPPPPFVASSAKRLCCASNLSHVCDLSSDARVPRVSRNLIQPRVPPPPFVASSAKRLCCAFNLIRVCDLSSDARVSRVSLCESRATQREKIASSVRAVIC